MTNNLRRQWDFDVKFPSDHTKRHRHAVFLASKCIRTLLGVSLDDMELRTGIDRHAIAFWELGQRMPSKEHWQRYRAALLELFAAYIHSVEEAPDPDPRLFVGSTTLRDRLGLKGHCEDCLEKGHKEVHPGVRCIDVGCRQIHVARSSSEPGRE